MNPGGNDETFGVNHLLGGSTGRDGTQGHNLAFRNSDVGKERRIACAIHDASISDDKVMFSCGVTTGER